MKYIVQLIQNRTGKIIAHQTIIVLILSLNFSLVPNGVEANVGTVRAIISALGKTAIKNAKHINRRSSFKAYKSIKKVRFSATRNIRKYNLRILNRKYAGTQYPLNKLPIHLRKKYPESVRFDRNGYPDFKPYAIKVIRSDNLTGQYANDFALANKMAGYHSTPVNYTWHHHQNGMEMLLIPKELHNSIKHSGGHSFLINSN